MIVDVQELGHSYKAHTVLDGISFSVPEGRVVGLVGPNAAGKTTLLRSLCGLLEPTRGEIRILGRDVRREPQAARRVIGYLPERASVYPELLVWEYLDLFADIAGFHGAARKDRIEQALARALMQDRAEAPARELSKGLQQRLAMAAVMMHDPQVVVLDEPTDGLDPESRQIFLGQVRALALEGHTVFLSSHVLSEIEQVAQTVFILVNGRLQSEGAEPAAAGKTFVVRVRGDLESAAAVLRGRAECQRVVRQDAHLMVDLAPSEPDGAVLVTALVGAGIAVSELREVKENLRRRFARAVGRGEEELA